MKNKAFTLIEVLVVVLIIGILSAIALPQYQKAVERAKMAEAVINLRAIANANQIYYMTNGVYAEDEEIDKLDVQISGVPNTQILGYSRMSTNDWIFSPNAPGYQFLAIAQRAENGQWLGLETGYYLYINRSTPDKIGCTSYSQTSDMRKKLCSQINANGTL